MLMELEPSEVHVQLEKVIAPGCTRWVKVNINISTPPIPPWENMSMLDQSTYSVNYFMAVAVEEAPLIEYLHYAIMACFSHIACNCGRISNRIEWRNNSLKFFC